MNDPVKLVPGKSDKEFADELRMEILEHSKPLLEVLNKGNKLGFSINVQFAPNFLGQMIVNHIIISKLF